MVAMERRATCFGARAALYARSPWWTASPAVPVEPAAPQQREGVLTPSRMLAVDYFNPKHATWRCAPALEPSARPAQRLSAVQLSPLTGLGRLQRNPLLHKFVLRLQVAFRCVLLLQEISKTPGIINFGSNRASSPPIASFGNVLGELEMGDRRRL